MIIRSRKKKPKKSHDYTTQRFFCKEYNQKVSYSIDLLMHVAKHNTKDQCEEKYIQNELLEQTCRKSRFDLA